MKKMTSDDQKKYIGIVKNLKHKEKIIFLRILESEYQEECFVDCEIVKTLLEINDFVAAHQQVGKVLNSGKREEKEKLLIRNTLQDYFDNYFLRKMNPVLSEKNQIALNYVNKFIEFYELFNNHVEIQNGDIITFLQKLERFKLYSEGALFCDTIKRSSDLQVTIFCMMSIIYRLAKCFYKALGAAQQGHFYYPANPWPLDNMARAYVELHLYHLAQKYWAKCIELSADSKERNIFLELLKEISGKIQPNDRCLFSFPSVMDFDLPKSAYPPTFDDCERVNMQITPDENVKLISVDIWDTVLRRHCHPDEVKVASARFLLVNYRNRIKIQYRDIYSLFRARLASENRCKKTASYEYCFEDVSRDWVNEVFEHIPDENFCVEIQRELLNHELNFEIKVTFPDEYLVKFLKEDATTNVIFLSDFYHSKEFIEKLLSAHGLSSYFAGGLSSSDVSLDKKTGLLFKAILQKYNLDPHELLHIGDNISSDYKIPKSLNINSYHYEHILYNKMHTWREEALKGRFHNRHKDHYERILALLEQHLEVNLKMSETKPSKFFELGVRISPIIIGFILYIIELAKDEKVKFVHFFTREGAFFQAAYDKIVKLDPYTTEYPESVLLEVSRLSTFGPSLMALDRNCLMRMWNQYSSQSPKAFCQSLGLPVEQAEVLFERKGIDFEIIIQYPWLDNDFMDVIGSDEFKQLFDKVNKTQRKFLQQYLEEHFFDDFSGKVIVDIGWRGTIQDNIACIYNSSKIVGVYLGLQQFLNTQPANNVKYGWLFDYQKAIEIDAFTEIAPLEMIFNCPGGSSVSYCADKDCIQSVKDLNSEEDLIYFNYTQHLQKGIMSAIPCLIEYVHKHALIAEDFRELSIYLARTMLNRPPDFLADAFFELNHNETFGTGQYDKMSNSNIYSLSQYDFGYGHDMFHAYNLYFKNSRWISGLLNTSLVKSFVQDNDNTHVVNHFPSDVHSKILPSKYKHISIYAPPPLRGSGGHRTIYNLARRLLDKGCRVEVFLEAVGDGVDCVKEFLNSDSARINIGWKIIDSDYRLSTIAHSANYLNPFTKNSKNGYFVQDFEAYFNPVGDWYLNNEISYSYDLSIFSIGNWLAHFISSQFGVSVVSAGLGVDHKKYNIKNSQLKRNKICFLYQPEKSRRCTLLGLESLKIVKDLCPNVEIVVYGSDAPLQVDFSCENYGFVSDIKKLNDIYNECSVGLCLSMTNPSRIPFEYMACGVVPVDLYRYNNLYDYAAGTALLAYQSKYSISSAIISLLNSKDRLYERQTRCLEFISTHSLDWEVDVIANAIISDIYGKKITLSLPSIVYTDDPFISDADFSTRVVSFCEWQRNFGNRSQDQA